MISLFRLFSPYVLKQWALFIIASSASILVLGKFFGLSAPLLIILFYLGLFQASVQMSQLVGKNLPWIIALPLSKRKILVFKYLLSIFILFVFALSNLVVVSMVSFTTGHKNNLVRFLNHSLPDVSKGWSIWLNDHSVGLITVLIIGCSFIHAMCLWIYHHDGLRKMSRTLWTGIIALVLSSFAAYPYFSSGFGQVLVWCFLFMFFPALQAASALSMSQKQRNSLIGISLIALIIEVTVVYRIAISTARDETSQRRVEAILFLGKFGQVVSQTNIAKLLESDIADDDFSKLADFYLDNFHEGKKIRLDQDQYVHLDAAISSKKSERGIAKTVSLFDPSELSYSDIKLIFDKLLALRMDHPPDSLLFTFLSANGITTRDLIEFLKSNNKISVRYALIKSRYDRNADLIPQIETQIVGYTDELRLSALKTLSILSGKYVGLDAWAQYKNGSRTAPRTAFFDMNCTTFNFENVNDLKESDLPALNICMRQKADRKNARLLEAIESWGWIDLPLNLKQMQLINKIFK